VFVGVLVMLWCGLVASFRLHPAQGVPLPEVTQSGEGRVCTTTPSQFSSRVFITLFDDDECLRLSYEAYFFYDITSNFTRLDISFSGVSYSVYNDYDAQLSYVYNRNSNGCSSSSLRGTIMTNILPNSTVYEGTLTIGGETFQAYSIPAEDNTGETDLTLAKNDCSVLTVSVYNYTTNNIDVVETFYDFFEDVPFNVFNLPSICTQPPVPKMAQEQRESVTLPFSASVQRKLKSRMMAI